MPASKLTSTALGMVRTGAKRTILKVLSFPLFFTASSAMGGHFSTL